MRQSGLVVVLICTGLVWLASISQQLVRVTGLVMDVLVTRATLEGPRAPTTALVEWPLLRTLTVDQAQALVAALRPLGARQVLFTFTPEGDPAALAALTAQAEVQVAMLLVGDERQPDGRRPATALPAADAAPPLSALAPSQAGIHRQQARFFALAGAPQPALEWAAYQARHPEAAKAADPAAAYRVDFTTGTGYLPRLEAAEVLSGRAIPEQVQGRSVLIGRAPDALNSGVDTPLPGGPISLLEFQGRALDTLLRDAVIEPLSPPVLLLTLLGLAAATFIAYAFVTLRQGWLILLASAGAGLLLSIALLNLARLEWPLVEMLLLQFLLMLVMTYTRRRRRSADLSRLAHSVSTRVQDRVLPAEFLRSREAWPQIIALIQQVLPLRRMIFLERLPEQTHVREIAAEGCSITDIAEMRRDIRRTPYLTAIASGAALRLDKPFLAQPGEQEVQFLVPLQHGEALLGFWAFGIEAASLAQRPGFEALVTDIQLQVSELLAQRRDWLARAVDRQSGIGRALELDGARSLEQALNRSVSLLEKRLDLAERAADALQTGFVVFDAFGRVLLANQPLRELCRLHEVKLYEVNAQGFTAAFAGCGPAEATRCLQQAVFDGLPVALPVTIPGAAGAEPRRLVMHLRALPLQAGADAAGAQTRLGSAGYLFELVDVGPLHALGRRRRLLAEVIDRELGRAMQALSAGSAITAGAASPASPSPLEEIAHAVRLTRDLLGEESFVNEARSLPVDLDSLLAEVAAGLQTQLDARQIELVLPRRGEMPALVVAEPEVLRQGLHSLLEVLLDDALDGSRLTLSLEQPAASPERVVLLLDGEGLGMPQARINELLQQQDAGSGLLWSRVHGFVQIVPRWQALLSASAGVGIGICFRLALRRFELAALQPAAPPATR